MVSRDYKQDKRMMIIEPEDMIGRTFLGESLDNRERHRAKIVKAIGDNNDK